MLLTVLSCIYNISHNELYTKQDVDLDNCDSTEKLRTSHSQQNNWRTSVVQYTAIRTRANFIGITHFIYKMRR